MVTCLGLGIAGCQSAGTTTLMEQDKVPFTQVGVQPGDTVRITFPAAQTMNSIQQVQSDGTIALPLGGTLLVKDRTSDDIQKILLEKYGSQIVVQEISVSVESAGFPVYVSGAVGRPGRVQCRQSMTVLEAVVEAGGFAEGRADLKNVKVVRQNSDGTTRTYVLDLKKGLKGENSETFYLRPSDVVYVPERFSFY
jgi:polysaccharide export outer membrane protein